MYHTPAPTPADAGAAAVDPRPAPGQWFCAGSYCHCAPPPLTRPEVSTVVRLHCDVVDAIGTRHAVPRLDLPTYGDGVRRDLTGVTVHLDVADATSIDEMDAAICARALIHTAHVHVEGADPTGVAAISRALDAAFDTAATEVAVHATADEVFTPQLYPTEIASDDEVNAAVV